jgi:hypothetical protein
MGSGAKMSMEIRRGTRGVTLWQSGVTSRQVLRAKR